VFDQMKRGSVADQTPELDGGGVDGQSKPSETRRDLAARGREITRPENQAL
jgi:hypothetical protein